MVSRSELANAVGHESRKGTPRISFSATNPCHVYDLAVALRELNIPGVYYSGYPRWKLRPPPGFSMRSASLRTLITYGWMRLPEQWRPASLRLFRWQDRGFDNRVARMLEPADYIHGLPGQCLETFRRARALGLRTVLNHASGPLREQIALLEPEYARAGIRPPVRVEEGSTFLRQLDEECELADYHCAASTVVRGQLIAGGFPKERIWVVPYGADPGRFPKRSRVGTSAFTICFAGQLSLRKGLHYLLRAAEQVAPPDWKIDIFGPPSSETSSAFQGYKGRALLKRHGAVSQERLGEAFGASDVLVLPSVEEAFGLVVVQALQSGLPCIVSDRVGAKDLIQHRVNGSIVPFGNISALAEELKWWSTCRRRVKESYGWEMPARELLHHSIENWR